MSKMYEFPCKCRWPLLEENPPEGCLPLVDIDTDLAPDDCPATWALLGRGMVKGVFQLESPLGRDWTRKLKPETYEHITALGALLRPGSLQAKDENGVSMTQHYVLRKNGVEDVKPYHPDVDDTLKSSYSCMIFQEQFLRLSRVLAGFDLIQMDVLRKSVGKKDVQLLASVKEQFISGCAKVGKVNPEQAEEIWGWIQACGRYSFNKCVSEYTNIRLANGSLVSVTKLYESMWSGIVGDVYGLSMTDSGGVVPNRIVDIRFEGYRQTFMVETESGAAIWVTDNHKFPTQRGEVVAGELKDTDSLYLVTGDRCRLERVSVVEEAEFCGVYDIEMAAPHHNFVVQSGIVTCNSHAACYGVTGYRTAYLKTHAPLAFFTAWLLNAHHKQDPQQEIYELVNDARLFDIEVQPPDLRTLQARFHTDRKVIKFGLSDIKGVGGAQIEKLRLAVGSAEQKLGKPVAEWSWWDFLRGCASDITSSVVTRLIRVGALKWLGNCRARLLAEFQAWEKLTEKEKEWVNAGNFDSLVPALKALSLPRKPSKSKPPAERVAKKGMEEEIARLEAEYAELCEIDNKMMMDAEAGEETDAGLGLEIEMKLDANRASYKKATRPVKRPPEPEPVGPFGGCNSDAREAIVRSLASTLENPPSPIVDTPVTIAYDEEDLLGISLTCTRVDACDTSAVNCTLKEFAAGRKGLLVLGVQVEQLEERKTKSGKNPGAKYGRLMFGDGTCSLNAICWPEQWAEYGHLLAEGCTVIVQAERDFKDPTSSTVVVKKVWQARSA